MKIFKWVDATMQTLMFLTWMALFAFNKFDYGFLGYFVLGGWQVLSMFLHLNTTEYTWKTSRKVYHWLLVSVLLTIPLVPFIGYAILMLWMCFTPLMALYYIIICINEVITSARGVEENIDTDHSIEQPVYPL